MLEKRLYLKLKSAITTSPSFKRLDIADQSYVLEFSCILASQPKFGEFVRSIRNVYAGPKEKVPSNLNRDVIRLEIKGLIIPIGVIENASPLVKCCFVAGKTIGQWFPGNAIDPAIEAVWKRP